MLDPIAEIGALAQQRNIPLHVDACVGGFMLPWIKKLGFPVCSILYISLFIMFSCHLVGVEVY